MTHHVKLRAKILISLIGLAVIPLALALTILHSETENLIDGNLHSRLEETARFVVETMEDSRRETRNYTQILSRDADLINSVVYADSPDEILELGTALDDAINVFNLDLVQVVNAEGKILRRLSAESFAQLPLTPAVESSLFRSLLEQKESTEISGITTLEGYPAIVAVSPIRFHRRNLAYLMGVTFLDRNYAERIQSQSGAGVTFYTTAGKVFASGEGLNLADPAAISGKTIWQHEADEASYLAENILLNPEQGMVITLDRSSMLAARQNLERLVLVTLSVVSVLAILIGVVISRGIVRPLGEVVANLREIAEGEANLTRTLQVRTGDEVGELATSFNSFLGRLRETVRRTQVVREELAQAMKKIKESSRELNQGALRQSQSLEESHKSVQDIEQLASGIADNVSNLLMAAEESSSATLQVGSTTEEIAAQMEIMFGKVEEVIAALTQMSSSSEQISESVGILSGSTQETAASVTEFDAAIREIEQSAERTNRLSDEAVRETERGKQAVDESIAGIQGLCQTVEEATRVIQNLGSQSQAIGKILTVIDDVADQTGLLALNAAIIAAQAGEHGRGFAVVADEIGELAERTAISTREIATIIKSLQSGTRDAVEAMTQGNEKVRQEAEKARIAGEVLVTVRTSTLRSSEEIRGIVRATQEQARGSQAITRAVNNNTDTVMQIAAAIRQHSHGIQHLNATSEDMRDIAARVKTSTGEQTLGSRQISQNMEQIRAMIESINDAARNQSVASHQVVAAVSGVREIAQNNVVRTRELDQVVEALSRHTRTLKEEIGSFKV